MQFQITPNRAVLGDAEREKLMADPAFGRVFTDHMVTIRWTQGQGWHDAQLRARAPFQIDPASAVLHYGQEIFEGLKAYRAADGGVTLFRPEENARRFMASARRMAMPELPEELFVKACEALIRIDEKWVPGGDGSLYLRPFMFANESLLGVRPASEFQFCTIACPVGAFFKGGVKPVTIWISDKYSRAGPGGTGAAKCGGNYAASLVALAEAIRQGCDQAAFLDAAERKWVEELGGMNLFFLFADGSAVTPPLTGTILPGITRDSVLHLLREEGVSVEERPYSMDEWRADAQSGRLAEVFACGTAAVIAAVGEVRSSKGGFKIGDGVTTPRTDAMRERLTGIQRGRIAGPDGWVHKVPLSTVLA